MIASCIRQPIPGHPWGGAGVSGPRGCGCRVQRREQTGVAPFPGEDSGTRFSDIARFRDGLVTFCPSRTGGHIRVGGDVSYLMAVKVDITTAKRTSPAEARSILPDAARNQAQRRVKTSRHKKDQRKGVDQKGPSGGCSFFTVHRLPSSLPSSCRIGSDVSRNCHSRPRCGARLPLMLALPCLAAASLRAR